MVVTGRTELEAAIGAWSKGLPLRVKELMAHLQSHNLSHQQQTYTLGKKNKRNPTTRFLRPALINDLINKAS